jgi:hypothetical protein
MTIFEIAGGMLRAARSLTGLSQQELAERASISGQIGWPAKGGVIEGCKILLHRAACICGGTLLVHAKPQQRVAVPPERQFRRPAKNTIKGIGVTYVRHEENKNKACDICH